MLAPGMLLSGASKRMLNASRSHTVCWCLPLPTSSSLLTSSETTMCLFCPRPSPLEVGEDGMDTSALIQRVLLMMTDRARFCLHVTTLCRLVYRAT